MDAPKEYKAPAGSVFSDTQWNTMMHILDAFIPALSDEETAALKKDYYSFSKEPVDEAVLDGFARTSATDCAEVVEDLHYIFTACVPPDKIKQLSVVLDALNTRPGSFVITGYTTPLALLPRSDVEKIVQGWATARLQTFRAIYKSFSAIFTHAYQRGSPAAHQAMAFPGYPFSEEGKTEMERLVQAQESLPSKFHFEDLEQINTATSAKNDTSSPLEISTDILILGSGSGGSVVAAHLASSLPHHQVMVVEKGFWYETHEKESSERQAMNDKYEDAGTLATADGTMTILAGSTWGGGSTINWGASWQIQGSQRKEWRDNYGLKFVTSSGFQQCLDEITSTMSCQALTDTQHNVVNTAMINGSHQHGYRVYSVPQNILGNVDDHGKICGAFCHTGCKGAGHVNGKDSGKQGGTKSFLPIAREHGAKFVQGFEVQKILMDNQQKVIGVKGLWRTKQHEDNGDNLFSKGREVFIKANRVIVSGGTLNSPAILLRSGLKNAHIGRNLHLHPAIGVTARWKEMTKPWEGGILTTATTEFDNIDGKGHGTRIEGMMMLPGIGLTYLPWGSALNYRQQLLRFKHITCSILVCRDRDSGRITIDPTTNKLRAEYTPSDFDLNSLHIAYVGTCKILHAAGAEEIYSPHVTGPRYRRLDNPAEDEVAFENFIEKLEKTPFTVPEVPVGSAHQMGTCRMGTAPNNSVVDDHGRVWGSKNLYVADASIFPSASGVNPMVTTMALSLHVAKCIVEDIRKEDSEGGRPKL